MRLIVLVPFVTGMHSVEILRFPGTVLVFPVVRRGSGNALLHVEELFLFVQISLGFRAIHGLGEVRVAWCFHLLLLDSSSGVLGDASSVGA